MNPFYARHARTTSALAFTALLGACVSPPVEAPTTTVQQQTNIATAQTVRNKVDLLFMVDNSSSMSAMQTELISKFPTFLSVFNTLAHPTDGSAPQYADLHVGVVTSDFGAGATGGGGCDPSPGGQKGLFQAVGAAASSSCKPPTSSTYIQYAFGASGDTCNIPGGCTASDTTGTGGTLGTEFTCQASVGAGGCGFEHQLESVYSALTSTNSTNAKFLRDDAILAVVFVTNEDDSSSPPSVDIFNPDPSKVAQYGAFTTYRQTHFGVECGGSLTPEGASSGQLMSCQSAPNTSTMMVGQEYDISRYIDLFTTPGKLKASPSTDIILVGINGPTTPFQTILAETNTGNGSVTGMSTSATYVPCSPIGTNCIAALQHSCQNIAEPAFFADPPVRLDTVINAAKLHDTEAICGTDLTKSPDYTAALQSVAKLIVSALQPSCLTAPINTTTVNGKSQPDCIVQDVVTTGATTTTTTLPFCGNNGNVTPCWTETDNLQCPKLCDPSTGKLTQPGISINRGAGVMAPAGDTAQISCNTIALANEDPYKACGTFPDGGLVTVDGGN